MVRRALTTIRRIASATNTRIGWDTSNRNREAVRLLELLGTDGVILDVCGGESGLSSFTSRTTVCIDIAVPTTMTRPTCRAPLAALPIRDRGPAAVACIDVLEYLTPADRSAALVELVRVTGTGLVLGFPCGVAAQRTDEAFATTLRRRGRTRPAWLDIHGTQTSFPAVEEIAAGIGEAAARFGRTVTTTVVRRTDPIPLNRLIRAAAARGAAAYASVNVAAGVLSWFVRRLPVSSGYRAFVAVRLD